MQLHVFRLQVLLFLQRIYTDTDIRRDADAVADADADVDEDVEAGLGAVTKVRKVGAEVDAGVSA